MKQFMTPEQVVTALGYQIDRLEYYDYVYGSWEEMLALRQLIKTEAAVRLYEPLYSFENGQYALNIKSRMP